MKKNHLIDNSHADSFEKPKTPTTPLTPNIDILIVEDNPYIAKYLNNLLKKKGYKCLLAFNASEAMAQYQTYKISLILLDLEIPGTHGTNLANQIKNLKLTQQSFIVGFSKYHRDAMQFFALKNGIDDYIRDYRDQEDVIDRVTQKIPLPTFTRQSTTNSELLYLDGNLEQVPAEITDSINFKYFKCTIL